MLCISDELWPVIKLLFRIRPIQLDVDVVLVFVVVVDNNVYDPTLSSLIIIMMNETYNYQC
ncbi:hypothetical protein DERF_005544 [Dermatophagoides farinae]|uniref:Uncharacterized protein n=1 Tax=Dermatophagoides farinae TaxID=6954 RepID=A0A922I735_DERFA|nr:hypothetical protein DERF_005544 [Dermatophagoides farinae]